MAKILKFNQLRSFIQDFSELLTQQQPDKVLSEGALLLKKLIQHDDWLPDEYAKPHPERYQQYLLHTDSASRFSVVSFVWGPGQATPIHDHRVWGLIGVLRGAEITQSFKRDTHGLSVFSEPQQLNVGDVDILSPEHNDIHQVKNAFSDQTSISIHVYGNNIGAVKRATYDLNGNEKPFISGYSNTTLPNIWDLSKEQSP